MSGPSILLVDPFRNLLNAYRMVLEDEGYCVETALTVEESLRSLSQRRFSVVITEYFPPPGDSYLLIRHVRERYPETFIIMITNSMVDAETYSKLFAIGLDDLILKPYSPEKILVHIRKGLRQRELVLKMEELERQSLFDPATDQIIFNRAYFKQSFRRELKRARRHQHPVSLLLLRIPTGESLGDGFRSFCTQLASILRSNIREEDLVGRENGSFGIVLPQTDHSGSQALLKRLMQLIEAHPLFISDDSFKPFVKALSFQSFTYPETFAVPEFFRPILDEVNREYDRH